MQIFIDPFIQRNLRNYVVFKHILVDNYFRFPTSMIVPFVFLSFVKLLSNLSLTFMSDILVRIPSISFPKIVTVLQNKSPTFLFVFYSLLFSLSCFHIQLVCIEIFFFFLKEKNKYWLNKTLPLPID